MSAKAKRVPEKARLAAVPRPTCCESARRFAAVFLGYVDWESTERGVRWHASTSRDVDDGFRRADGRSWEPAPEPRFCPFCAAPLPAMARKKDPPRPLQACVDGNYCATCGERVDACGCYPAMAGWEPVMETRVSENANGE